MKNRLDRISGLKLASIYALSSILSLAPISATASVEDLQLGVSYEGESSICNVAVNYGHQAYMEKSNNPEASVSDTYTLTIYGLSRSDEFKSLSEKEKLVFSGFVGDIFKFVYESSDLTKDNLESKVMSHCLSMTDRAWSVVNERVLYCQNKGRVTEYIAKIRDTGKSIAFTRQLAIISLKKGGGLDFVDQAIDSSYSNPEKTPSAVAKDVYDSCIKSDLFN